MTLVEAKAGYFAAARESVGCRADTRFTLSQAAASLAAQVARANPVLTDIDIARVMRSVARECYGTAVKEKWTNRDSLDIADEVFQVVLIWFCVGPLADRPALRESCSADPSCALPGDAIAAGTS